MTANDGQTLLHPASQRCVVRAERPFTLVVGDVTHGPFVERASVGSARGNDVALEDPTVSRFHFEITRRRDGLHVVDVGSKNGTFVNGVRVVDAILEGASELRAGDTTVAVRVQERPELVEEPYRTHFGQLLGQSAPMQQLFRLLGRLALVDTPVLVHGETGSGKELVARALHEEGRREAGPFVVFDCGAVAPTLAESELFGHARGAFTGADVAREGAFERADGGTLFLDEIGELDPALQPKLLRALESKTIRPVGGDADRKVDVRVVSATHRDLRQMVNDGRFREDLFHRIAVFTLRVPPLRERPDDLVVLAQHFLTRALAGTDFSAASAPSLTSASIARLTTRSWSGNVRELKNVIERALVLGDLEAAAQGDIETSFTDREDDLDLENAKRRFERQYLVRLLAKHDGDRALAAQEADVHIKSLGRLLRRHGLTQKDS